MREVDSVLGGYCSHTISCASAVPPEIINPRPILSCRAFIYWFGFLPGGSLSGSFLQALGWSLPHMYWLSTTHKSQQGPETPSDPAASVPSAAPLGGGVRLELALKSWELQDLGTDRPAHSQPSRGQARSLSRAGAWSYRQRERGEKRESLSLTL